MSDERKRALFFGDSNTWGFNPDPVRRGERFPEEIRWTGILKKRFEETWIVEAEGQNGRCIPSLEFELEDFRKMLKSHPVPDLFSVMLGTNDYLSRPHPDPDKAGEKLSAFLHRVRTQISSRILVIAPPLLDFSADRFYRPFSTLDGKLSRAVKAVACEIGADYLDAASWDLEISPDDHIHLTENGHREFAAKVGNYLEKMSTAMRN